MKRRSGKSLPLENFRAIELDGEIDLTLLAEHFTARSTSGFPVLVLRNAVQPSICSQVCSNFWRMIRSSRGNRSADDIVSVAQVGAHQFGKTGSEYLQMVETVSAEVSELFAGLNNDEKDSVLSTDLAHRISAVQGLTFRPAIREGKSSGECTARSWAVPGDNSLLAHEDFSQLSFAAVDGFEISEVASVIAYNLCVANESGGELVVWNLEPSQEAKNELQVQGTGYPYPSEWLEGIPYIEVNLRPGDAYFLKANFIHAVRAAPPESRITLGRFIGKIESRREIVYWT